MNNSHFYLLSLNNKEYLIYLKPIILEFWVKIYSSPLLIIGFDKIGSPIFLKYSAFPKEAEQTIKYPFDVTAYIFPLPITNPETLVSCFLFFSIFKIFVEEIVFPVSFSNIIKYPLLLTIKILFLSTIGTPTEETFFSQLRELLLTLNEKNDESVEKIISLSIDTISDDLKKSVASESVEEDISFVQNTFPILVSI